MLSVFVSVVNSNQMSLVGLHPISCKWYYDAANTACCQSCFHLPFWASFPVLQKWICLPAFPGVQRPLCFVFFINMFRTARPKEPKETGMHWTQRGREGEIFFLSNGSGSAISLSFKKTSKEVGVGSIFLIYSVSS